MIQHFSSYLCTFQQSIIRPALLGLLSLLFVAFANTGIAAESSQKDSYTIIILGDSISAGYGIDIQKGWVSLLQDKLKTEKYNHYTVVNASISGNTTGDGLSRLPKLLEQYSPSIVIVELGGNDGLRGYPVKLMEKNLQTMIDLSQQKNAKVVLAGIEIPPNYGARYTALFRKAFQKVAAANTVSYIPFILEGIALNPELMQQDGIHPTEQAQPKLLNNIWGTLLPLL